MNTPRRCNHKWERNLETLHEIFCSKCNKRVEDFRLLKSKKELIESIESVKSNVARVENDSKELQTELNTEIEINKRLFKYLREARSY